jgi:hypothetical protein
MPGATRWAVCCTASPMKSVACPLRLAHSCECFSEPSARPHSEIIDYRRRGLEIALAPNDQRRIVERSSHIVRARANGHGICYPIFNSAAKFPGVAKRPSTEEDSPSIRENRTTDPGASYQRMNVSIKSTMAGGMENRTREITKDITMPPRTQYIRGSHVAHIRFYTESRKTDRQAGICAP